MERQFKKAFRSPSPKYKRIHASRKAFAIRKTRHNFGGVMIVPPPLGVEHKIDQEMKKIRQGYIDDYGVNNYENHLKKINEDFRSLMAEKGVRI